MIRIAQATTAADLAAVRALCWDYWDFLLTFAPEERQITQAFYPRAKYEEILQDLPSLHARPDGVILLAKEGETPVGCGMTQRLNATTVEIKRVFVSKAARGKGVARDVCKALMDQAKDEGYVRVMLDTSINLVAAQSLYLKLGFQPRGPYQPVPPKVLPFLKFFEKAL